jgi:hypothetical protein
VLRDLDISYKARPAANQYAPVRGVPHPEKPRRRRPSNALALAGLALTAIEAGVRHRTGRDGNVKLKQHVARKQGRQAKA